MTEIDMRDCMLFVLMPQIEISHQHTARQKHKHTRCVLMTSFWQLGSNTVPLDGICNYCNAWSDMYPSIMICYNYVYFQPRQAGTTPDGWPRAPKAGPKVPKVGHQGAQMSPKRAPTWAEGHQKARHNCIKSKIQLYLAFC
jgi:hypothetical protein